AARGVGADGLPDSPPDLQGILALTGCFEQRGETCVVRLFACGVETSSRVVVEEAAEGDDLFTGRHRGEELAHVVCVLAGAARKGVGGVDICAQGRFNRLAV